MEKLLVFITVDIQSIINAWIDSNIENAGFETFSSPLSSDGLDPVTHYWCCWRIDDLDKTTLTDYLDENHDAESSWYLISTPEEIDAKLTAEGLQRYNPDDI